MIGPRPWDRASQAAAAALVMAVAFATWTGVGAWRVDPWPLDAGAGAAFALNAPVAPDTSATAFAVLTGTEQNPFRPDRRRPPTRYRLPSERVAAARPSPRSAARVPVIRLLGIAQTPGRPAVAALGLRGEPSRLVRVGDALGGFEVTSVDGRQVTLVGADTTVVLSLDQSGARSPTPNGRGW